MKIQSSSRYSAPVQELSFRARRGWKHLVPWIFDRLTDRWTDRKFGIDSGSRHASLEPESKAPDSTFYQPASYRDLRHLFSRLPISSHDVFLDYGSGKGRVLCIAATYPFDSVIGVELSPSLCTIARRNVERVRSILKCQNVQVVESDAADYPVPPEVTLLFFFNPFIGETLSKVLGSVGASWGRNPRRLLLVFYGTVSSFHFRSEAGKHTWLRLESELVLATGAVALVYATTP